MPSITAPPKKPTVGVILGAAVWADGPSPTLRRRTRHGARLFHAGYIDQIVVCGGLGKHPPTEAKSMAEILVEDGVSSTDIRLEDQSTNTGENLSKAFAIVGDRPILIITDWYHAPRAKLIARRAGFTNIECSAPSLKGARLWPQLKGALREIPAYIAYAIGLKS